MSDDVLEEYLKDVIGVVEANSFEKMCLWQQNRLYVWQESLSGYGQQVGEIGGKPIWISLNVDRIYNRKVLFVEATSQVVDWEQIENWLKKNIPSAVVNNRLNKVDALNFTNVFRYVTNR